LIDQLIDRLFELIIAPSEGPALASHMSLTPPAEASHFVKAPRPVMTRADMERPDAAGLIAELDRILEDLPADARAEALGILSALADALGPAAEGDAQPSSLIYALH
jgi:hypothetical protein